MNCALSGHNPHRFKFKYDERQRLCTKLKKALTAQIIAAYERGVRRFFAGGAPGVDTWASEAVLELKTQPVYADMELVCVVPFPEQDARWILPQRARYRKILAQSSEIITISPQYNDDVYRKRNCYMVDNAEVLIAVYDNDKQMRSGVGQAVRYAEKRNREIILIHPDTAKVTVNAEA